MVFHWNQVTVSFRQFSRTVLSILADLNNALLWMVSILLLNSNCSNTFSNPLGTVSQCTNCKWYHHHPHVSQFYHYFTYCSFSPPTFVWLQISRLFWEFWSFSTMIVSIRLPVSNSSSLISHACKDLCSHSNYNWYHHLCLFLKTSSV